MCIDVVLCRPTDKRCIEKEAVQSQGAEQTQPDHKLALVESTGSGLEEGRANDGAGSKRNLSFQLQAVESTAKRLKRSLEVIVRNSAVGAKRRVGGQTDKRTERDTDW